VIDPVLASAALPAVLPPVEIDGELHLDGAIVDNVPINRALLLGATRLVVLHAGNFHRDRPVPKRPIEMLVRAMTIGRNSRFDHDLDVVPSDVEVILPPGIDPGRLRYNDFSHSADLIERAHRSTETYLRRSIPLAATA
jgi:NTE family protein